MPTKKTSRTTTPGRATVSRASSAKNNSPQASAPGPSEADKKVVTLINRYAYVAGGAMIAIPIPGVDMAATYAVWGKMIHAIAEVYGEDIHLNDAKNLASDLFKGVILTTVTWFASAKAAATVLKFIPGAGTALAYLIDAAIAGFGAKKITAALGLAAAAYFKSGKTIEAKDLLDEVGAVLKDPEVLSTLLGAISPLGLKDKKKSGKT